MEIRRCRTLTSRPFGVNLTILPALIPADYDSYAAVVAEERVAHGYRIGRIRPCPDDEEQCADWVITAEGTRSTMTIDVTYENVNTTDCGSTTCAWSLSYILNDLDAGTWTVNADGQTTDVVVD